MITKMMAHRGSVSHLVKGLGTFGNPVSFCGRWLCEGEATARLCKSCVRIAKYVEPVERPAQVSMPEPVNSITAQPFQSWEYDLTRAELDATIEKIAKINERCSKRGIPGGLTVEYTEEIRKEKNDFGIETEWTVYPTHISGIAPQLEGWQFIATIDYDQHAGLIVRTYPGVQSIDRTNIREGWCEHCKTTRYRKQTYVMYEIATGKQIQVGSSCIKDFTGWTALPVSLERLSKDIEEMSEGYGTTGRDFTTQTVLSVAWACVQTWGFVRSGDYRNVPTVQRVRDVLNPPKQGRNPDRAYLAELARIKDQAAIAPEKAQEIIKWIASEDFAGFSEYVLNLKAVAGAAMVSSRNYGLLCSAPQAWARWQEKTLVRKQESGPVSEWQGKEKEAITITATIEAIRYIESEWGSTTLYKMRDANGNLFEWFASRDALGENTETTWAFTATVKAHKEWKGHKTTQLTRVRKISQL